MIQRFIDLITRKAAREQAQAAAALEQRKREVLEAAETLQKAVVDARRRRDSRDLHNAEVALNQVMVERLRLKI
jgi:hypothetical protein